jgi:hypothetical protein
MNGSACGRRARAAADMAGWRTSQPRQPQGRQLVDRLTQRGEHLAAGPRADRRVPEYSEDDLREVLERPYLSL